MKAAFATTDGVRVDEHFGRAGRFAIYEFTEHGYVRLKDRVFSEGRDAAVESTREQGARHEDAVEGKVIKLSDCRMVYLTQIGGPSAARLSRKGIMPVKVKEGKEIEELARELMESIRTRPAPWLRKALGEHLQEE